MGSPPNEPDRLTYENLHRVTISKPFYMQTTPVTQGQWKLVMGDNPSRFKDCGDDCPVAPIYWADAQEFIKRINLQEGKDKYRLPTEAEWEYAARAGTTTAFNTGNCLSTDQANYNGDYLPLADCPRGVNRGKTVRVGSFAPNSWGLYDMHGNVSQWVQDCNMRSVYDGDATDPVYDRVCDFRIYRGGSCLDTASKCRSAYRFPYVTPVSGGAADPKLPGIIGVRLVRTP
jgi:formylglycine-generating enzyme required for sulfatase activity